MRVAIHKRPLHTFVSLYQRACRLTLLLLLLLLSEALFEPSTDMDARILPSLFRT